VLAGWSLPTQMMSGYPIHKDVMLVVVAAL
jgi:hypothetical protein